MEESKLDPRVLRTRQLIMDAFRALVMQKDIKDITVGDITGRAKINRATFYAHFADKYALLDSTFEGMFREGIMQKLQCHAEFSRQSLTGIIETLCEFHREFSTQCQKNYDSMGPYMEVKIKQMLQEVLFHLMDKRDGGPHAGFDAETARTGATMLAWSLFGITHAWNAGGRKLSPEELAAHALTSLAQSIGKLAGAAVTV
ncbi:TetR/AcrR family transcriptional regulator [Paenibacillus glycinis]|uniref:TetR family transcriptional regulator n=1 Tax=Paenibacillus glycinis TaxID=2697035 RepID=A0ABW9XXI7_9BACL|nr:TetR family transcriptional regulator [Paenibacillus glycinis]NBD27138.1 TetR family transcriptional regulator [Paenibacillus glycinis]